ncbi:MAG: OmpA family protein [Bacteroidota bacterium]
MNKNILFAISITFILFLNILSAQNISSCNIFFVTDSSNLSVTEKSKLKDFTKNLDTIVISHISILGYCDDLGSKEYNYSLSFKRANCVKDVLTGLDIKSKLITKVQGKGKLPILEFGNQDIDQQRAFNRRVEIVVEFKIDQKNRNVIQNDSVDYESIMPYNLQIGDKIILENILFVSGKHELLPSAHATLDALVKTLHINNKYHIMILGYVCCVAKGQDAFDHDTGQNNLSEARAKTIYDYLIKNGVEASRLDFKGLKSDFPTGKSDKYDRRVEIEVTDIVDKK